MGIEGEGPAFIHGANQLALEDQTELIGKKGQQDLVGQFGLGRLPIDIEIAGVVRAWSILQHVPPPQIRRMGDAHMVGHDVDHQAHAPLLQAFGKRGEFFLRADFRIETGVVGDVVAVHAAGVSHQKGRGIAVADPEIVEILHK